SDEAGNNATQASASLTKDTVAPTVTLNTLYINAANASAVPLSGSCSENGRTVTIGGARTGSGTCVSGSWTASVDYSGVADGSVSVTADHADAAGNDATQATRTLTKDTEAPTASISGAPTGTVRTTVLGVTISGSGVVEYRYSLFAGG